MVLDGGVERRVHPDVEAAEGDVVSRLLVAIVLEIDVIIGSREFVRLKLIKSELEGTSVVAPEMFVEVGLFESTLTELGMSEPGLGTWPLIEVERSVGVRLSVSVLVVLRVLESSIDELGPFDTRRVELAVEVKVVELALVESKTVELETLELKAVEVRLSESELIGVRFPERTETSWMQPIRILM